MKFNMLSRNRPGNNKMTAGKASGLSLAPTRDVSPAPPSPRVIESSPKFNKVEPLKKSPQSTPNPTFHKQSSFKNQNSTAPA